MTGFRCLSIATLVTVLAACGNEAGRDATLAGSSAAAPAASPASAPVTGIALPPGFTATIFADELDRPRHIAVRDNGDVFVALRSGRQQIVPENSDGGIAALRDTNGDGIADVTERFGRSDVDTGLAIHDAHVYFSSAVAIYAVPLDSALAPSAQPELVAGGFEDSGGGHTAKPITFDRAGHLYTQAGAPSNSCQQQDRVPGSPGQQPCGALERFGGVWRFIASGRDQDQLSDGIRYSTGHRNVVALEWNPAADRLFLAMHGRDQLDSLWPAQFTAAQRSELPAEELHVVDQGDDLGWPYTYYDQERGARMLSPEYGGDGQTPAEPGKFKDPLIGFPGHWAPNDLLFYTGTQFPDKYRGGAFIAFHGSWNRELQDGYSVVFVPMHGADVAGDWEIFADDFEGAERIASPADAQHRPSGLALGPDGSLYVSDDVGGRIWKITYTGD